MTLTVETIIRNMTVDPEHVIALLEYSYMNSYDAQVNALVDEGVIREAAHELVLRKELRRLEGRE